LSRLSETPHGGPVQLDDAQLDQPAAARGTCSTCSPDQDQVDEPEPVRGEDVALDNADVARSLIDKIDWPVSYCLGSVPVNVVSPTHFLSLNAHHDPEIVMHRDDEDDAWRAISDYAKRVGRPPRMLVVVT
jgi:hypothetical protein